MTYFIIVISIWSTLQYIKDNTVSFLMLFSWAVGPDPSLQFKSSAITTNLCYLTRKPIKSYNYLQDIWGNYLKKIDLTYWVFFSPSHLIHEPWLKLSLFYKQFHSDFPPPLSQGSHCILVFSTHRLVDWYLCIIYAWGCPMCNCNSILGILKSCTHTIVIYTYIQMLHCLNCTADSNLAFAFQTHIHTLEVLYSELIAILSL